MERYDNFNGILVYWDDTVQNVKDTKNAVYKLVFDNMQVYFGSCKNLYKRIKSHCSHVKSNKCRNLYDVMLTKGKMKVVLLGTYDTIDEAQLIESMVISNAANKIFNRSRLSGEFKDIVNNVILNKVLYIKH